MLMFVLLHCFKFCFLTGIDHFLFLNNNTKTRGPWATVLTYVNRYKSLIQHFTFSVDMATNQSEKYVQLLYAWWRTSQHIKKISVKIPTVRYFHFSHFKAMETLSCHSYETTWATAVKNNFFVEANVMNISEKFQLHLPYVFWVDAFWIFFMNLSFQLPWQPINLAVWTKFICLVEDYSRNISVKLLSKYLQCDSNRGLLSLFPL